MIDRPELAEGMLERGLRLLTPHKVSETEPRRWLLWLVQKRRIIETVIGQLVGRYNAKKVWPGTPGTCAAALCARS